LHSTIIALMMEAVRTSETSVSIYLTTRQYIPEDSKLHTRHREILKSHTITKSLDQLVKVATGMSFSPVHCTVCHVCGRKKTINCYLRDTAYIDEDIQLSTHLILHTPKSN
jgi:hypothetical protein